MRFDIITIFPGLFTSIFEHGVVKRAIAGGLVDIGTHDLREFTHDRHRTVDDRPFGGGEGMVLKPEPLAEALEAIGITDKPDRDPSRETVILLSAQGKKFTQATARELAKLERVVLICGRYEGVDERVNELSSTASSRSAITSSPAASWPPPSSWTPPCASSPESSATKPQARTKASESEAGWPPLDSDGAPPRSTHGAGGLLDYPHYTRPAEFRGLAVPEVLSGRRPPKNQPLAPRTRIRKDAQKSPRPAGNGRAKRSRP